MRIYLPNENTWFPWKKLQYTLDVSNLTFLITFKYDSKLYIFGYRMVNVSVICAEYFYHMQKYAEHYEQFSM
jgi:hypothetical protein